MLQPILPPELSGPPATMQIDSAVVLTMVLPSFLEEENLRLLLPRLSAALDRIAETTEVIVVDTCNPLDATEEVCRANSVRYIRRGPTNDFGDAVRTGIAAARGKSRPEVVCSGSGMIREGRGALRGLTFRTRRGYDTYT